MTRIELENEVRLRLEAENRLKAGSSTVFDNWTMGPDALSTLYRLASSQDSAADALKLLHELQVHQVELGLQHEQMVATEREMAESLTQFRNLYEWAPLAYFVVDWDGAVIDLNYVGARLLGAGRDAAAGRHFAGFLSIESRATMQALLTSLRGRSDSDHCDVRFSESGLTGHITASASPGGEVVLMMVSQAQGSGET